MSRVLVGVASAMAALCILVSLRYSRSVESASQVLAHAVYFTLNESTPETRQQLVDACQSYLSGHDGTVFFATGTRATDKTRDVNDTDFDVSLHIYFRDEAAHDAYQEHPRHAEFIEKMSSNWKTVRVFDAWVRTGP
ncbi:MAG: Dabb family protein [Acidobacteria bacterium]|nr:Dabb family protein [Acidobacteriota bacterium]